MISASALIRYLMFVSVGCDEVVAFPTICSDRTAGLNMMENEGLKGIGGTVQGHVQTNAPHSFLHVSAFHRHGDDGFPMGTAAAGAGFLATDEKFIHLHASGQLTSIVADGAASELLQPNLGRLITAEAQELLKIDGIDTGFAGGEPPHGFESVGDRLLGTVHDGTGRQRMLMLALGADIQIP